MAYTGPGDVVAVGANGAFYGLRGYNAAYATGSNNAIKVTRDGGSTSQDLVILSSGYVDLATAISYAAGNTLHVMTLYDQSGNGRDVTQTTDGNRPTLVTSGTFPYMSFDGSTSFLLAATNLTAAANTYSLSLLIQSTSTVDGIAANIGTVNRQMLRANFGSAGTGLHYNGSTSLTFTFANNSWHSASVSVDASDNGTAYIDGVSTGPSAVGGNSGSGAVFIGVHDAGPGTPFAGYITEMTYWDTTALSSGQVATINTQQTDYQAAFTAASTDTLMGAMVM